MIMLLALKGDPDAMSQLQQMAASGDPQAADALQTVQGISSTPQQTAAPASPVSPGRVPAPWAAQLGQMDTAQTRGAQPEGSAGRTPPVKLPDRGQPGLAAPLDTAASGQGVMGGAYGAVGGGPPVYSPATAPNQTDVPGNVRTIRGPGEGGPSTWGPMAAGANVNTTPYTTPTDVGQLPGGAGPPAPDPLANAVSANSGFLLNEQPGNLSGVDGGGGAGGGASYDSILKYQLGDNWMSQAGYGQSALTDPRFSFGGGYDAQGNFIKGDPNNVLLSYLKSQNLPEGMMNSLGDDVRSMPGLMELQNPDKTFTEMEKLGMVDKFVKDMTTPGKTLDAISLYPNVFSPERMKTQGITAQSTPETQEAVIFDGLQALAPYIGGEAYGALQSRIAQAKDDWQVEYSKSNGKGESFLDYLTRIGADKWLG